MDICRRKQVPRDKAAGNKVSSSLTQYHLSSLLFFPFLEKKRVTKHVLGVPIYDVPFNTRYYIFITVVKVTKPRMQYYLCIM